MYLFELLLIVIISLLVMKPEDIPKILAKIRQIKFFILNTKQEIMSHIDPDMDIDGSLKTSKSEEHLEHEMEQMNFYLQKIKMATFPNIDTIINFILSYQSLKKFSHRLFFNKLKFFLSNSKLKRVFLEKLLSLIRFKIRHEFMDKFKFHRTKLNVINNFLGLKGPILELGSIL